MSFWTINNDVRGLYSSMCIQSLSWTWSCRNRQEESSLAPSSSPKKSGLVSTQFIQHTEVCWHVVPLFIYFLSRPYLVADIYFADLRLAYCRHSIRIFLPHCFISSQPSHLLCRCLNQLLLWRRWSRTLPIWLLLGWRHRRRSWSMAASPQPDLQPSQRRYWVWIPGLSHMAALSLHQIPT